MIDQQPSSMIGRIGAAGGENGVVYLSGEHDVSTVDELSKLFAAVQSCGHQELLVDLSEVTFMDASTVGALARARTALMRGGRKLKLRHPSAAAQRTLQICGFQALFDPLESVA